MVSIVSGFMVLLLATWTPGTGATGDNTYAGNVDQPAPGVSLSVDRLASLSGWFVDTSAQGWSGADDIQVFAGSMDTGTPLGHGQLGVPRPDVAASLNNPAWGSAGWRASIDPGALPLGQNTLSIYVHTPSKGWWYTQLPVNVAPTTGGVSGPALQAAAPIVTVLAPLDGEQVSDRLGNYRINGTARDPVSGAKAIDRVQVWLNGEKNTDNASFIGDADIATDGSWELDFSPSQFTPITSNLYAYAHSDVTNKTTLVVVHFVIVDHP